MPESEITESARTLKKKRDTIKTRVNNILNFAKKCKSGDLEQLESRKAILPELAEEFSKVYYSIQETETNSDQADPMDEFDTLYHNAMAELVTKIKKFSCQAVSSSASIKLPEVNLPKFDGQFQKWTPFYCTFKSLIADNGSLDDLQKFHYLKSSLEGEALRAIDSLALTKEAYKSAWEILEKRYQKKRLIVQEHVKSILNLQTLSKSSHTQLRQLLDAVTNNLESLKNLKVPVQHWDAIIIQIIASKLDFASRKEYELTLNDEIPILEDCIGFLEKRCRMLESLSIDTKPNETRQSSFYSNKNKPMARDDKPRFNQNYHEFSSSKKFAPRAVNVASASQKSCVYCNRSHYIYACPEFLNLSPRQRFQYVQKVDNLCVNCLRTGHVLTACRISGCKLCNLKHSTLLHDHFDNSKQSTERKQTEVVECVNQCVQVPDSDRINQVLLSTAMIQIADIHGKFHNARALLDNGSQINIISEKLSQKLKIQTCAQSFGFVGVGQIESKTHQTGKYRIASSNASYTSDIICYVLPNITSDLPTFSFPRQLASIPQHLQLADPHFNISSKIDILLGAETFWDVVLNGRIVYNKLHLAETKLGWILGGVVEKRMPNNKKAIVCQVSMEEQLNQTLTKFWEDEQVTSVKRALSINEQACERHFCETYRRDINDGRFIVELPFKDRINLGDSYPVALARLKKLELRFKRDPDFHLLYKTAMQTYLTSDVLEKIDGVNSKCPHAYYFPHSGVYKESSTSTKLRIVFDGSAKPRNGESLNDSLLVGPTMQDDLFSLMIRFRGYKYAFTADIEKMYLQVKLNKKHQDYQRVLWRENANDPIEEFRLKTVTFGLAPSSFLAIRCLYQLAEDVKKSHPLASEALINGFYVDDLVYGADTKQSAERVQWELTEALSSTGFNLKKWASNEPSLLAGVDTDISMRDMSFTKLSGCVIKTLGVNWDISSDKFMYTVLTPLMPEKITKRSVLSEIARLFDPLGLLSPVIIKAKIFMQKLWLLKINWDTPLPDEQQQTWIRFLQDLPDIQNISIPRLIISVTPIKLEMHAFGDASIVAMGAVIYLRAEDDLGNISVNLVSSKSKVAPIKTLTLPRLELNAAVMATRLAVVIENALHRKLSGRFFWTDSSIVLHWISASPNTWQVYVANRVAEIQSHTNRSEWQHVASQYNPADLITRGRSPRELNNNSLWFQGPAFLSKSYEQWPKTKIQFNNIPVEEDKLEKRKQVLMTVIENGFNKLFSRYSSFSKLLRVLAYCFRWYLNFKNKITKHNGQPSSTEIEIAHKFIMKMLQKQAFAREVNDLSKGIAIHNDSRLKSLDPFLDKEGLIRVGGRIRQANLDYDKKFPIVLPSKHEITKLIIHQEHLKQLHSGVEATLYSLRLKYWPLSGRNSVKRVLRNCIRCYRVRPKTASAKMADLPAYRLEPIRPFFKIALDVGGPLYIKQGNRSSKKLIKSYFIVFVCLATKAYHIELISDLTSETFLNALKRFTARRGGVSLIICDNATNFHGANNELLKIQDNVKGHEAFCKIEFRFSPPRSPHFNGLAEHAIKRVKEYIKKIAGNSNLTYEEMYSLLVNIEGVLNSRPLIPLSSDPNDLSALTPGHFLIGEPLTAPVEVDLSPLPLNRLSRWQRVEQLKQHFWKRFQKEVLSQLQTRCKWRSPAKRELRRNDLVLIVDDNTPPLTWKLGRVTQTYKGADGHIRVADVKTKNGVLRRGVTRLCPLPNDA